MGRFEELQPAVLHVGHVAPAQVQLQQVGVVRRPEQHRLVVEGDAVVAVGQHRVAHGGRLGLLVAAGPQQGPAGAGPVRPQDLGHRRAGAGLGHHRVGHGDDRRRGAVVLLQAHDGGAREPLGELEEVAAAGGPEAVDGLGVVAHHGEAPARRGRGRRGCRPAGCWCPGTRRPGHGRTWWPSAPGRRRAPASRGADRRSRGAGAPVCARYRRRSRPGCPRSPGHTRGRTGRGPPAAGRRC